MNQTVEEFISARIDLIDVNEWNEIYTDTEQFLLGRDIGAFTDYMYAAGIDPLDYLEDVPDHFLFYGSLINPHIPSHIKAIGHSAFGNSSVESVVIPNECERIFSYAFVKCENLKSIHLGDKVKSIGANCFFDCKNLSEINFPKSLFEISASAFKWCDSLPKVIELDEGLEVIRQNAFELSEPRTYIIPKTVRRIHQDAFLPKRDTKLIIDKENTYAIEWAQVNDYEYEVR